MGNERQARRCGVGYNSGVNIEAIDVEAWNIPMRAPYRSAQRVTTTARNVLVALRLEDGSVGYGEAAPAAYVTGETQDSVLKVARTRAERLTGRDVEDASRLLAGRLYPPRAPGADAALEMALADAVARSAGMPLYRYLTGGRAATPPLAWLPLVGTQPAILPRLTTDLSLPILPPAEARERAEQAVRDGYRALKIKVGSGDSQADIARVRTVADAAPDARLLLDGNQGFEPEEAVGFVEGLTEIAERITLFEQPTKAGVDNDTAMRFVAERVPFPVFADESVKTADDARRLILSATCAGVVLKIAKAGLSGVAAIARAAQAAGGRCLFGCMMESRVAIGAALHLALALGAAVTELDLDSHCLVDDTSLITGGLRQEGDVLIAPDAPGLGLVARSGTVL